MTNYSSMNFLTRSSMWHSTERKKSSSSSALGVIAPWRLSGPVGVLSILDGLLSGGGVLGMSSDLIMQLIGVLSLSNLHVHDHHIYIDGGVSHCVN